MKSSRLPLECSLIIVFSSTLVDSSASTPSQRRQNFDLLKGCKWWETKREGES